VRRLRVRAETFRRDRRRVSRRVQSQAHHEGPRVHAPPSIRLTPRAVAHPVVMSGIIAVHELVVSVLITDDRAYPLLALMCTGADGRR
jgi:hypothetical protein